VEIFLGFACSQRDFWLYCRGSRPRKTRSIFFPWPFFKGNRFIVFSLLFLCLILRCARDERRLCYVLLHVIDLRPPPTAHSIYFIFEPFDTHKVATNVCTLITAVLVYEFFIRDACEKLN